jgi:opacity protein-like surface antigen
MPPADATAPPPGDITAPPADPVAPPPPPPPPPSGGADTASPTDAKVHKKVAFEIGAGVGLNIATGGLSLGPNFFLDVGARFHLGPGFLAVAARGGYQRYTASGEETLACGATVTGACIASDGGRYTWDLVEETVTIGLPISYRLFPDKRLHPYFGVIPQIFLLRATTTAYGLENNQGDTKFGFAGLLGAQFDVGPGGVFLDAGFQYAALEHKLTGMSNIGAVTIGLGYRVAL